MSFILMAVRKVLNSAKHSLIALLKFHPELPRPQEGKEEYWSLAWDRGFGEQPGSDPQRRKQQPTSHHFFSTLSQHCYWTKLWLIHCLQQGEEKERRAHTVISCGGGIENQEGSGTGDWRTAPFPLYDLMQVKGEAWSSAASLSSAPHWRPLFRYLLNLLRWNRRLCADRLGIGWHTSFHARQAMNGEPNKVSTYPIP